MRLVVFEGLGRNPIPIFNEKAVLRLGRGLNATGMLNEEGLDQALMVMGLPASALWPVPVDAAGALSIPALEQALERAQGQGRPVLAVVATAGK